MKYLIWSMEHCAWWKASRHGYTTATHNAGQFSRDEAIRIVAEANQDGMQNEVMMTAPSADQIMLDLRYPDR